MIGIKAIKSYFVGNKISLENLPEATLLKGEELDHYNTTGIKTVYDSGDISSYQLALGAAQKILDEEEMSPESIDIIIYIKSRVPDFLISSEATRLKHDLKTEKALTFSISDLGCVDSTMAIKLAKELLIANTSAQNVLITYGSKQFTPSRFRFPVTITGDGGVACIIGRTEQNKIIDVQIDSNGNYWDLFKLEYKDRSFEEYQETCSDIRKYGFELALESRNRFMDLNQKIAADNGRELANVNHFLMQNITIRAYDYYQDAFGFKLSPFCRMNLSQYGHLGAADILLNYQTLQQAKILKKGATVIVMNNSPVAAWSSILIEV